MSLSVAMQQRRIRRQRHQRVVPVSTIIISLVLLLLGLIMVLPFWWSIVTSFTPEMMTKTGSLNFWFVGWTWDNWKELAQNNWALYIANTLIIAAVEILASLFFCTLAAYAFAKFEFPGKPILYRIMLFSMMVPGVISLIPQFIVVSNMNLIDSFFGIILPQAVSIYGILFLKQFFVELSNEIGEAARVDGASEFKIYWIYFRMAIPGITTLGLFTFVSNWNAYLWPSLILWSESKFTLALALNDFYVLTENSGAKMAASILSIVPIIVLFAFTQKYFMNQTTYTGDK